MFNALKYIRSLEAVGFKREQAEAQVQLVVDAIEEDVATKADLNEVRFDLKSEFAEIKSEFADMKSKMHQLDVRMTNLETNLENKIVLRLGRTIVVCSTLMLAAIGLMLKFQ